MHFQMQERKRKLYIGKPTRQTHKQNDEASRQTNKQIDKEDRQIAEKAEQQIHIVAKCQFLDEIYQVDKKKLFKWEITQQ